MILVFLPSQRIYVLDINPRTGRLFCYTYTGEEGGGGGSSPPTPQDFRKDYELAHALWHAIST